MRISDWSSDMCSSDLLPLSHRPFMAFCLEDNAVQDRSADYAALAAHLNPDDPGDGARQIDATIIAYQRARCRPGNHGQLVRHLGMLLMLIAETIAVFHGMLRSEEHTSELQSLMRISYAVFCLKKKKIHSKKH